VIRINLLPDHVIARQRRKRGTRAAAAAAAVALAVGSVWATVATRQLNDIAARTAAAQARLSQERDHTGKIDAVTAQAAQLRALLAQGERLNQPVTLPGALTLLANLLPESVALTRLTIEAPAVDVADHSKQVTKASSTSSITRLSLEGLAINDLELAQVVSEIAAQKAFTNVKLVRSRPMAAAGATRYAFEISIDMPPAARAADARVAEVGREDHGG
jgi:hypothetical protein